MLDVSNQIRETVKKTHPRLEDLFMLNLYGVIAKRTIINVGLAGTGKSAITNTIATLFPSLKVDVLTRSGLKRHRKALSGFRGVLVVDDLGKTPIPYNRITTLKIVCALTYSHCAEKSVPRYPYTITDFYGGSLVNTQPFTFIAIVHHRDFDSNIRDKSIRVYHLYKPVQYSPENTLIQNVNELFNKLNLKKVYRAPTDSVTISQDVVKSKQYKRLLDAFIVQHTENRAIEHLNAMLKAIAVLNGRSEVVKEDLDELLNLIKHIEIEKYFIKLHSVERGWMMDIPKTFFTVEFASYGIPVHINAFVKDMHMDINDVRALLIGYVGYVKIEGDLVYPDEYMDDVLDYLGMGTRKKRGRKRSRY